MTGMPPLKPLPKRLAKGQRTYLPKRPRRPIQLDTIHPVDFRRYELAFFCDDCSHFSSGDKTCMLGYRAQHTRAEQEAIFELTGRMALCRAIEID